MVSERGGIMEISFIIPVYNGEQFIRRCICEIRRWEWEEQIEILIIDDGSTDCTGIICDEEAAADKRVKVFHIENCGQGLARNYGLRAAAGKYICFADADDRVDTRNIYRLWEQAKSVHADVAMGGYYRTDDRTEEWVHVPGEGLMKRRGTDAEMGLYHKVKTQSMFGYVWNKLYRRQFLREQDIWMDDIRTMNMEDFMFNMKVWSRNPVFYCMDCPICYYITAHASTTRRPDPQVHTKSVNMIRTLVGYLDGEGVLEENLDMVVPVIMRSFCWSMIKNIPYEGMSMRRLEERAGTFAYAPEVEKALGAVDASKHLKSLVSAPQRWFYRFCMCALKRKMIKSISRIFYICYPLMKRYASAVLK